MPREAPIKGCSFIFLRLLENAMTSKKFYFYIVESSIFLKCCISTLTFVFCLTSTLAMAQQDGNNSKGPSSLGKVNLKKQAKLAEAEAFVRSAIETCEAKVVQEEVETVGGRTATLPSRNTIRARSKVVLENGRITFLIERDSSVSRPAFQSDLFAKASIEAYARISDLAPTVGVVGIANAPWLVEGNMIAIECALADCWTRRKETTQFGFFNKEENKRIESKQPGSPTDSTYTERVFLLGVCPGMAERLQKALNEIILLNGGKRGRY